MTGFCSKTVIIPTPLECLLSAWALPTTLPTMFIAETQSTRVSSSSFTSAKSVI
jgi:hypothetical protein